MHTIIRTRSKQNSESHRLKQILPFWSLIVSQPQFPHPGSIRFKRRYHSQATIQLLLRSLPMSDTLRAALLLFSRFLRRSHPTIRALLRSLFLESNSDVLSLAECTRLPDPSPLFTETLGNPIATAGESCFSVFYHPHQLSRQVGDYGTDTADDDQTDTTRPGNTVLNSLKPFPYLRTLSGPTRSLLRTTLTRTCLKLSQKTIPLLPSVKTTSTP